MQGYTLPLYDLAWSPDGPSSSPYYLSPRQGGGSQLASAGADSLVTLWEVESSTAPRVLRGHRESVHGVAWSPDGHLLASGTLLQGGVMWNVTTGSQRRVDPTQASL